MQVKKKRSSKRFVYRRPIPFINMGEGEGHREGASGNIELVDLSDGGMKLRVEGPLPVEGSIVQLRIPISGITVALPVIAQIKWARKVQSKLYNVGLQFLA